MLTHSPSDKHVGRAVTSVRNLWHQTKQWSLTEAWRESLIICARQTQTNIAELHMNNLLDGLMHYFIYHVELLHHS